MRRVELKFTGDPEPPTVYSIGNIFFHNNTLWSLCRTGKDHDRVQMTHLFNGIPCLASPVTVDDEFRITPEELVKIVGPEFVADFEQVELSWAP